MILQIPRPGGHTLYTRVDTDHDDLDEALAQAKASQKTIEADFKVVSDSLRQVIRTIQSEKERENDR